MKRFLAAFMMVMLGLGALCAQASPKIFVASSLIDFAEQVAAEAEVDVTIVAGGSSVLARQIEAGAPADLFISANQQWADNVAMDQLLMPLFANELVLVSYQKDVVAIDALPQLLGRERLAMADPNHVPAGIYAKAALEHLALWAALSPHIAAAQNVRGAARFVQSGAAAFGVVYASDAKALDLHIAYRFSADTHPPIRYWAVNYAPDNADIATFLAFIQSDEGHRLLAEFGFQPSE
ncbi:molybdate ABC transporter substrate-binding protein [Maritalea myrionectae]|nr:molybdate ABC transporter substrate-binding protein [Maritalea myrionectae]